MAYGHLDCEKDIVWLGVCVGSEFQGKGIGKVVVEALIKKAEDCQLQSIKLSVDKSNMIAQRLYEKFGFTICSETEEVNFMRLDID